jgi:hypothetical protein
MQMVSKDKAGGTVSLEALMDYVIEACLGLCAYQCAAAVLLKGLLF